MKKVRIFLTITMIISLVAGIVASFARLSDVIYSPNNLTPSICDVPQFPRSFVANPQGSHWATRVPGMPCVKGTVVVLSGD